MKPSTNTRLALVAAAAAATVSLSACGSGGVMHDAGTAGSFDGQSVSNEQVHTAVKQIGAVSQGFDGESAAAFILLLPKLEKIGHQYGLAVSASDVKAMFPGSTDLAESTVQAARGSVLFTRLRQHPKAAKQVEHLLKNADVDLNPRYGQWIHGQGPTKQLSPWIKQVKNDSPATS